MRLASLGIIVSLLTACGEARHDAAALREAWNPVNDPLRLGNDFDYAFAALPLAGKTSREPWTDSYWPSARGGIASRWVAP